MIKVDNDVSVLAGWLDVVKITVQMENKSLNEEMAGLFALSLDLDKSEFNLDWFTLS